MQISLLAQIQTKKSKPKPKAPPAVVLDLGPREEEWDCLGWKVGAWQPPRGRGEEHEGAGTGGEMKEPLGTERVHLAA